MGCTNSKLLDDGTTYHNPKKSGAARQPIGLARLSVDGQFSQWDAIKGEQPSLTTSQGIVTKKESIQGKTLQLQYAYVSQRGYYPDQPNKSNQDAVVVEESIGKQGDVQLFGVFDGHGECGTECAQFVATKIPENIKIHLGDTENVDKAVHAATLATNSQLHASPIDDSLSGTTACLALIKNLTMHIANVGDSRAVLAIRGRDNKLQSQDLSIDQTPFRADECERVVKAGARVLTLDQVEGLKDMSEPCWTNEEDCDGDPPRLWAQDGTYPGTAFTRSIGDSAAEAIGVFAQPEIATFEITPDTAFLIVATDGVWEFISSQRAVEVVSQFTNPQDAANALVATSYKAWLQREPRTDDISVIIINFSIDAGTVPN